MKLTRSLWVCALLGAGVVLLSCQDRSASKDTNVIQQRVKEMREQEQPPQARRAPGEEDLCDGVSEADVARVEARLKEMNKDLVVFGAEDMKALACSRSRHTP